MNVGAPTKYTLPVSSGFTSGAKYSKDQFNRVLIEGQIVKSSGYISSGEVVATMPEGFKPVGYGQYPLTLFSGSNGTHSPAVAILEANGDIKAGHSSTAINQVFFNIYFSA